MTAVPAGADPHEIQHFSALASRWWDPQGEMRTLHHINPVRAAWVLERVAPGIRVADVGCGGGLLAEALSAGGLQVTGLDAASALIDVAKLHLKESGLKVDFRAQTVADLADEQPGGFQAVTCMEMLEHVDDPLAILADCKRLLAPGGQLFLSTINRTPKAFALGIVAAEYLLRLVPRGTHHYPKLIKPSELARGLRRLGFEVIGVHGMAYDPLRRSARITDDPAINYLLHARRTDG
jgi:2-polyprenyl-6-hydroxyphenyl methylase / 3-demethylubiquinone-9 3-methyltransferase